MDIGQRDGPRVVGCQAARQRIRDRHRGWSRDARDRHALEVGAVQACVSVIEMSQVGEARRVAMRVAETTRLDEAELGEVAVVATELARNLSKYGKHGRLFVQALEPLSGGCLEILAVDAGAG